MDINFVIDQPGDKYNRAREVVSADLRPIVCTSYSKTNDQLGKSTVISYDLFKKDSLLLIGLDLRQYANTINRSAQSLINN